MQTCSGSTPTFGAYTMVCTALSESPRFGMVHHLVVDTTGPATLRFHYRITGTKAQKGTSDKAGRP